MPESKRGEDIFIILDEHLQLVHYHEVVILEHVLMESSMTGSIKGFISLVKKKNSKLIFTLYKEALVKKSLVSDLQNIQYLVNF